MDVNIDIATTAAVVAAAVGVAKGLGLPSKYAPVAAMVLAGAFVYLPEGIRQGVMTAVVIGLTASGAYSYVKPEQKKPPP